MSAALQLTCVWGSSYDRQKQKALDRKIAAGFAGRTENSEPRPDISLAFYRKHTEKILQRYLYASMLVGRAPAILGEPIARGWATSRRVKTFEDAVIFVLDVENCLNKLSDGDRAMLSRITLQEYTQAEAADLLGFSVRAISYKYPMALDRLTELLLKAGLLILPED